MVLLVQYHVKEQDRNPTKKDGIGYHSMKEMNPVQQIINQQIMEISIFTIILQQDIQAKIVQNVVVEDIEEIEIEEDEAVDIDSMYFPLHTINPP